MNNQVPARRKPVTVSSSPIKHMSASFFFAWNPAAIVIYFCTEAHRQTHMQADRRTHVSQSSRGGEGAAE